MGGDIDQADASLRSGLNIMMKLQQYKDMQVGYQTVSRVFLAPTVIVLTCVIASMMHTYGMSHTQCLYICPT